MRLITQLNPPVCEFALQVPSEAPVHTAAYVAGYSGGLQNGPDPKYLQAASTAKHFLAYDLEGYIPRTDPQPRPASAVCDTPGEGKWCFGGEEVCLP